jgi:sugar phosphate permease
MNLGVFEIALLLGSVATGIAGARAAAARRRSGVLLILNAIFALVFVYFALQSLRFGNIFAVGLGLFGFANAAVASAIVARAEPKAPAL